MISTLSIIKKKTGVQEANGLLFNSKPNFSASKFFSISSEACGFWLDMVLSNLHVAKARGIKLFCCKK